MYILSRKSESAKNSISKSHLQNPKTKTATDTSLVHVNADVGEGGVMSDRSTPHSEVTDFMRERDGGREGARRIDKPAEDNRKGGRGVVGGELRGRQKN